MIAGLARLDARRHPAAMPDEWYRAWRHEDRDREARMAWDARFRRREAIKRALGEACLVGAIVMFAWSTFG